tara:strand:+ start:2563 stop:4086 length:1524 start_codon:yes stop_codon:yes gene_type:complete
MSRILRRPMFRGGGKISSYGKGITSGLTNGYAGGGQIGGGAIYGKPLPNGRFGFADPAITGTFNTAPKQARFTNLGGGSSQTGGGILEANVSKSKKFFDATKNKVKDFKLVDPNKTMEQRFGKVVKSAGKGIKNLFPEKGLLQFAGEQFPKVAKYGKLSSGPLLAVSGPKMIADSLRPKTYKALEYMKQMNDSGFMDETGGDDSTAYLKQLAEYNDTEKYKELVDDRGFFNKYLNPLSIIGNLDNQSDEEINKIVSKDEELLKLLESQTSSSNQPNFMGENIKETGKEVKVDLDGNPLEDRKSRLKARAKEYEEILGEGIKKDSIFDAMISGGTSLLEGDSYSNAARNVSKSLDPIQKIKTAARKAAVEEEMSINKAKATASTRKGANKELIEFYQSVTDKDGNRVYSDEVIAEEKLGKKVDNSTLLAKLKTDLGTPQGYRQYVRAQYQGKNIKFFDNDDITKIDFSTVPNGTYYQPPMGAKKGRKYDDRFIVVLDGQITDIKQRNK